MAPNRRWLLFGTESSVEFLEVSGLKEVPECHLAALKWQLGHFYLQAGGALGTKAQSMQPPVHLCSV